MILIKEDAAKMADLLRSGYTMLNLACPACNNPLFRDTNNKIYCPICNKQVIVKKEGESGTKPEKKENKVRNSDEDKIQQEEMILAYSDSFKKILNKKLAYLYRKLEKETHLDTIEKYLKLIKEIYNLLNI
ncbi:MAG: hypothetical protein GF353_29490 [Candidatus Lokiarchaeota archaeon]|nr:hypothetical protein [Candidatus Lokiarchaeota archaeon]